MKRHWPTILDVAAEHVDSETLQFGTPPTLRRLHYLLVSDQRAREAGYVNTVNDYKQLSAKTAPMRDAGEFPDLIDRARSIEYADGYASAGELLRSTASWFRLDRSAALPVKVILLAEKDGVVPLIRSRFDWLDVSAVKGYASVSHADRLAHLEDLDRETVGIYIGDYDPTGLDISRALAERLPYTLRRIGLSKAQVVEHNLPPMPAKATDSRTAGMIAAEGEAMQVELDALPSAVLLDMIGAAITDETGVAIRPDGKPDLPEVDVSEQRQRRALLDLAAGWSA